MLLGCHQADGTGLTDTVPSMRDFSGNFLQVPGGRAFLVQVPGSSNSPLNNAELAELLNWILLTMKAELLDGNFQYYTEREVAELRQHVLVDVGRTWLPLCRVCQISGTNVIIHSHIPIPNSSGIW